MNKVIMIIEGVLIAALVVVVVLIQGSNQGKIKLLEDDKNSLIQKYDNEIKDLKAEQAKSLKEQTNEFNKAKDELIQRYENQIKSSNEDHAKVIQQYEDRLSVVKNELDQKYASEISSLKEEKNKLIEQKELEISKAMSGLEKEKQGLIQKYEAEIKALQDENAKYLIAVNDPTKQIPGLMQRTQKLSQELLVFFQKDESNLSTQLSLVQKNYEAAINDPEIWIDVKKCNEAKKEFRSLTEEYKGFAKTYQDFLSDKNSELVAAGVDINSIKTNITTNLGKYEESALAKEKQMGFIEEKDLKVKAEDSWNATGMTLHYGDKVYVVAKGTWSVRSGGAKISADGEEQPSGYNKDRFENVPLGALIWRLTGDAEQKAEKGNWGKKFYFDVKIESGQLGFVCNDNDIGNNNGVLDVKVIVVKTK